MTTDAQRLARAQELALNILLLWRARHGDERLGGRFWASNYMPFEEAVRPWAKELRDLGFYTAYTRNGSIALPTSEGIYVYDEKKGCWKKN